MTGDRARILVLEDRAADRLYLTTLLGYRGFTVCEAATGEDALAIAATERLDLVISDVLMPSMDGYEFVRRLRRIPSAANVPVIFYTATYHESDARALAEECGVVEVLIKPSEPEAILARVDAVLRRGSPRLPSIADEPFARHHARVTSDTLLAKVHDLEASERRMAALVAIGQGFVEERDPVALLNRVCETVREITQASYAMLGLFTEDLDSLGLVLTSGHDERTTEFLRQASGLSPRVRALTVDRRPIRALNPGGRPENVNLPAWHPPVHSLMLIPMTSRGRVYGFFGVAEKIGGPEFTEVDEIVAGTLGVQAGIAYENAMLINELESQAAALRESDAMTEFALAAAGIGLYERDLSTNRNTFSKALAKMIGVSIDASLDEFFDAVHPDDRDAARAAVAGAIHDGTNFVLDVRLLSREGGVTDVQSRGQMLKDRRGLPQRLISVMIDMTERRQLEAQLRQAQKMEAVGQLAGGVAHDFNNLLTAILGYSRFLLPTLMEQQQRDDVSEVIKAGERAVVLTRQLLAFSRRQPLEMALCDLNTLVRDLVQMLKVLIGEHIELTTDLAEGLAPVYADRGQIEQVVMNLVVNARDAMPSGGTIRIETANVTIEGLGHVQLVVADTGSGMSDETKTRLFEPFFTTKEVGKGTGLGLATVFGIVTQSGGTISVNSALGRGSAFTITLPMASGEVHMPEQVDPVVIEGTEAVLLVEDEETVRTLARAILERAGYRVVEAPNVPDALRISADRPFDLLVADVLMPGGTGPDLFRTLVAARPDLRVLYMSGYAKDTILDIRQLDAHAGFLAKPFTVESLTRKVREVLDR